MIRRHTITIAVVVTTDDGLGNTTTTSSSRTAVDILFAPEGLAESTGVAAPTLVGDATLYGNTGACNSDDTVTHANSCCDGSEFTLGTWQVVGGSKGWGVKKFALPIRRVAAA